MSYFLLFFLQYWYDTLEYESFLEFFQTTDEVLQRNANDLFRPQREPLTLDLEHKRVDQVFIDMHAAEIYTISPHRFYTFYGICRLIFD